MFGNKWEDIISKHNEIIDNISTYNIKINNGDYIEHDCKLDVTIYYNLLYAHIINFLLNDNSLFITDENFSLLNLSNSNLTSSLVWEISDKIRKPANSEYVKKNTIINELLSQCFNEKSKKFIQEICAQDIISSLSVAKEISSILNKISLSIEIDIKGEEEIIKRFYQMRANGGSLKQPTKIEDKFDFEYSNRGALIRNRVFKHHYTGNLINPTISISQESDNCLNYNAYNNFCQSAILHIGIERTGSTGTGFLITEDGYAITCAHVVENADEIYATIINGDGYTSGEHDGFEVYDAGDGKVVYCNKELDIAILKMEHSNVQFLPIEQRNILPELGEEVVVFGYPLGYEMPQSIFFGPNISFYRGYVSSNQVKNGNSITFLDIDVKSGNSGSPVISAKTGKVIGIMSGIKVGGRLALNEKMPYMIPIQHFLQLNK